MVSWKIVFTRQAQKDAKKLSKTALKNKVIDLLEMLKEDPFKTPLPFGRLKGDLTGAYSRRINFQHRLVYQILEEEKIIKVIRMWTHYE